MATDLQEPTERGVDEEMPEEGGDEEEEYVVEKIMRHRFTKKGKLEYFLKWKGFTDADNTWEPAENLNCTELVNVYETERKNKNSSRTQQQKKGKKRKSTGEGSNGFEKGFSAKEIVGATEENGKVYFLIKWSDKTQEDELVPASVVNVSIPQMVIAFYEARLAWSTVNTLGDDAQEMEEEEGNGEEVRTENEKEIGEKSKGENEATTIKDKTEEPKKVLKDVEKNADSGNVVADEKTAKTTEQTPDEKAAVVREGTVTSTEEANGDIKLSAAPLVENGNSEIAVT